MGRMIFIGCQTIDKGPSPAADAFNQPFFHQKIKNAVDRDPIDVMGAAQGIKYLLGAQRTAVVADHLQNPMAVRCVPQTGTFQ